MKILICTNHFYPETFKVNDIAWHLQEQGHEVTVLTAIPDYPKGHYFEGYGIFRKRVETVRGVKVYRAFIIPRGKGGSLRLALSYVSYALSSVLLVLYLCLTRRFDAVFVHETSPVMIGIPGVLAKKIQRIPLCFWVLDLWPESLSAAGGIRNKHVLGFFNRMTRWIYRHSDKILMSSNGFRESILKKGDFADKLEFFPNWGENLFLDETNRRQALPTLPDGFRIMFAGNMGEAQNFENVMEVARRLKDTNIRWILIGDGRKRRWLKDLEPRPPGGIHVKEPDDLAGDCCTDVCTDNNAQGLTNRQNCRHVLMNISMPKKSFLLSSSSSFFSFLRA